MFNLSLPIAIIRIPTYNIKNPFIFRQFGLNMSKPFQKQSRTERKNVCTVSRISLVCCLCTYSILTQVATNREVKSPNPLGREPHLYHRKATLPDYRSMFLFVFGDSASVSFSRGRRCRCCISCRTEGSTGGSSIVSSICRCGLGLSGAPSSR